MQSFVILIFSSMNAVSTMLPRIKHEVYSINLNVDCSNHLDIKYRGLMPQASIFDRHLASEINKTGTNVLFTFTKNSTILSV